MLQSSVFLLQNEIENVFGQIENVFDAKNVILVY
jgi:hypothetical protein